MGRLTLGTWLLGALVLVGCICCVIQLQNGSTSPSKPAMRKIRPRVGQRKPVGYYEEGEKEISYPATPATAGIAPKESELQRRLPNTVLIGVKKGGTRALLEMLALHPNVKSSGKEVHFFDRPFNYANGLPWYRSRMKPSLPGDIVIEKSPAYFVTPEVPALIRRDLRPDVKLLLVLRNPVNRAVSDFMQGQHHVHGHMVRLADLSAADLAVMQAALTRKVLQANGDAINPNASFISVSMYDQHMARWLRHFPLSQIFVATTDQLVTTPTSVLEAAARFLDLPPFPWRQHIVQVQGSKFPCLNRTNQAGVHTLMCMNSTKGRDHIPLPDGLRDKLTAFFQPHNERLFRMLGRTFESWRHDRQRKSVAGGNGAVAQQLLMQATDTSALPWRREQRKALRAARKGQRHESAEFTVSSDDSYADVEDAIGHQDLDEQDPLWSVES